MAVVKYLLIKLAVVSQIFGDIIYYPKPWEPRERLVAVSHDSYGSNTCFGITKRDYAWLGNKEFREDKYYKMGLWTATYFTVLYKESFPTLELYSISYKGKPLFGWFHVKLTIKDIQKVSLEEVIAQMETDLDHFSAPGSFVQLDLQGSCRSSSDITKYDYKPCQYAIDPFMQVANGFAKYNTTPARASYEWNVKLDFPACHLYYYMNDKFRNGIYFRTYIFGGETKAPGRFQISLPDQRRTYLQDYVYGAPDPAPPAKSNPDCSAVVEAGKPEWVHSRGLSSINTSQWDWPCQNVFQRDVKGGFGGRCNLGFDENYSDKKADHYSDPTYRYHCRRVSGRQAIWHPFGDNVYTEHLQPPPENWTHYPDIQTYYKQIDEEIATECKSCRDVIKELQAKGVDASTEIGRYIWGGRQAHGVLMAIACLFVYPVTNFMTRYFKGTYMDSRVLVNLHVWYSVHIYGIFTVLTLCSISLGIAINSRKFFGYSLTAAGRTHVSLGYLSLIFFVAAFVSNAVRCGEEFPRYCTIFVHFVLGAAFYYSSLIAIISSVYVPGSPGSLGDEQKDAANTAKFIILAVIVKVWPIFEIVVHALATLQLCRLDRTAAVLRDWAFFLVPIPRVAAQETTDEDGRTTRVWLFRLFTLVSLGATIIAVVAIAISQPEGHLLGPMSYTHVDGKFTDQYIDVFQEYADVA